VPAGRGRGYMHFDECICTRLLSTYITYTMHAPIQIVHASLTCPHYLLTCVFLRIMCLCSSSHSSIQVPPYKSVPQDQAIGHRACIMYFTNTQCSPIIYVLRIFNERACNTLAPSSLRS
jgi:hypothetical protein